MAKGQVKSTSSKPIYKSKRNIIIAAIGLIVVSFILIGVFGTPSAKDVFSDMQENMLKTGSVTMDLTYKLTSPTGEQVNMESTAALNMTSSSELLAKGNYKLNLTSNGSPISMDADYIIVGSNKYVRFNSLSSSDPDLSADFATIESKLEGNWIKARDTDTYTTFLSAPVNAFTTVLPTPFANLTDTQRQVVLNILRDKSTYTINESTKVEINDTIAYKYSITYDKDQYTKFENAIAKYVPYFTTGENDDSQTKTFNVWVDTKSKRIIKIEFTGTSDQGTTEGTIVFSDYNKPVAVTKPADYSIESELLN
jgi:hypothetical protein